MTEWLQEVKKSHYEVILSTLLPHPPDFAKVGGQWERLSSRTDQLKEGKYSPNTDKPEWRLLFSIVQLAPDFIQDLLMLFTELYRL